MLQRPLIFSAIFLSFFFLNFSSDPEFFDPNDLIFQDGIAMISNKNLPKAFEKFEYILVFFYQENCKQCDEFKPEFKKIQKKLDPNGPVGLGALDAKLFKDDVRKMGVRKTPAIKLLTEKKAIDYDGPLRADSLWDWIELQTKKGKAFSNKSKFKKDF